jgi:hypothetical protein
LEKLTNSAFDLNLFIGAQVKEVFCSFSIFANEIFLGDLWIQMGKLNIKGSIWLPQQ